MDNGKIENIKYLLKNYFILRKDIPIKDGLDIAPSWEAVTEMRIFQQIELLEEIICNQKLHQGLPRIFLYETRDLLEEIDKDNFRTDEDV